VADAKHLKNHLLVQILYMEEQLVKNEKKNAADYHGHLRKVDESLRSEVQKQLKPLQE
jgi:trans-2-enoyl-CoA reductase